MKISILTPTYNREKLLGKLYESLVKNSKYGVDIEWLIMDDGSKDKTRDKVEKWKKESPFEIKYYYQENQGKMIAINKLVGCATGDLILDCDSDDYLTDKAVAIIKENYEKYKNEENIYGICFLKYNQNNENMGNKFKNKRTTMFNLYFKEGETGEKAIVFFSEIRKQFKHELEKKERFITEARMYHKMDLNYAMICVNEPIMICEYQKEGYTKNIRKEFKENPYGYYEYFKEIFDHDMKHVTFSKRLYVIKHYILFTCLTNAEDSFRYVNGMSNKIIYMFLYLPGIFKTKLTFK